MVGVATSNACLTCRQRRIACDKGKPNCENCRAANRPCLGYDKFPIFINRTISGLQRRQHLEEAKPRAESSTSVSASASISVASSSTSAQPSPALPPSIALTTASSPTSSLSYQQADEKTQLTRLTMPSDPLDDKILDRFLQSYGTITPSSTRKHMPRWLTMLLAPFPSPNYREDPVIQVALKALVITRLARLERVEDQKKLEEGANTYVQALGALQTSMLQVSFPDGEDALVAAKILLLHEGFESTSHSLEGWNTHAGGVTRMIELRGAERMMSTPMSKAILADQRYMAMIQSLHFRTRSLLGNPGWRLPSDFRLSGQATEEECFQRLYDLGFDIGALMEDLDTLESPGTGEQQRQNTLQDLYSRGEDIEAGLDKWYAELSTIHPEPIYWFQDETASASHEPAGEQRPPDNPVVFPTLIVAELIITFWAIRLCHLVEITKIIARPDLQQSPPEAGKTPQGNVLAFTHGRPPHGDSTQTTEREFCDRIFHLATLIARSTNFCLSDIAGQHGSTQLLLPLRVARLTFEKTVQRLRAETAGESNSTQLAEAEKYEAWCHVNWEKIVNEKKVGYARDLERYGSSWSKPWPFSL